MTCLESVDSVKEGIELYHELSDLWEKAKMFARKWLSNSKEVMGQNSEKDRASEIDIENDKIAIC